MKGRRHFVRTLCGGFLVASLAAKPQPSIQVRRIGILSPGPAAAAEFQDIAGLLRGLGWIEGSNLSLEGRSAQAKLDRLPALANELTTLKVDLIVAYGTDAAEAAKGATATVPIVMVSAGDPVSAGLITSLARPGGNITGYSFLHPELVRKKAALLHEMLPAVRRVCVLINPVGRTSGRLQATEAAYRSLGLHAIVIEVSTEPQFLDALAQATRQRAEALDFAQLSMPIPGALMQAVRQFRLPTMVSDREDVEAGALMSFAADLAEGYRRVAATIDKILRGAKPADLPVELPTRFELVVNLKVAKELGITVPQSILLRADQLIR
ncbi:MAG TPA: ABC transporter substrate-binding protein [Burkholderiaceae bacterium]